MAEMTLREHFAIKCLAALLSNDKWSDDEGAAETALIHAENLLKLLEISDG